MGDYSYRQSLYDMLEESEENKNGETRLKIPGMYESYRNFKSNESLKALTRQPPSDRKFNETVSLPTGESSLTTMKNISPSYQSDIIKSTIGYASLLSHHNVQQPFSQKLSSPPKGREFIEQLRFREQELSEQSTTIRQMISNLDISNSPNLHPSDPKKMDYASQMAILDDLQVSTLREVDDLAAFEYNQRANFLKQMQMEFFEDQHLISQKTSDMVENMTEFAMRQARRSLGKETSAKYFFNKHGWICLRILYLNTKLSLKTRKDLIKAELHRKRLGLCALKKHMLRCLESKGRKVDSIFVSKELLTDPSSMSSISIERKVTCWRIVYLRITDKIACKNDQMKDTMRADIHYQRFLAHGSLRSWYQRTITSKLDLSRGKCKSELRAKFKFLRLIRQISQRRGRERISDRRFRRKKMSEALLQFRLFRLKLGGNKLKSKKDCRKVAVIVIRKIFNRWRKSVLSHHRLQLARLFSARLKFRAEQMKWYFQKLSRASRQSIKYRLKYQSARETFLSTQLLKFRSHLLHFFGPSASSLFGNHSRSGVNERNRNNQLSSPKSIHAGNRKGLNIVVKVFKSDVYRKGKLHWKIRSNYFLFRHWKTVVRIHKRMKMFNLIHLRRIGASIFYQWVRFRNRFRTHTRRVRDGDRLHWKRQKNIALESLIGFTEFSFAQRSLWYRARQYFRLKMAKVFLRQLKRRASLRPIYKMQKSAKFSNLFFKWRYTQPWTIFVILSQDRKQTMSKARKKSVTILLKRFLQIWMRHFKTDLFIRSSDFHRVSKTAKSFFHAHGSRRGMDKWIQLVTSHYTYNKRFLTDDVPFIKYNIPAKRMLHQWMEFLLDNIAQEQFQSQMSSFYFKRLSAKVLKQWHGQVLKRIDEDERVVKYRLKITRRVLRRQAIRRLGLHARRRIRFGSNVADERYEQTYKSLGMRSWTLYQQRIADYHEDQQLANKFWSHRIAKTSLMNVWFRRYHLQTKLQRKKVKTAVRYNSYLLLPSYLTHWAQRRHSIEHSSMKIAMIKAKRLHLLRAWRWFQQCRRGRHRIKSLRKNRFQKGTKLANLKLYRLGFRYWLEFHKVMSNFKFVLQVINGNHSRIYMRMVFDAIKLFVSVAIVAAEKGAVFIERKQARSFFPKLKEWISKMNHRRRTKHWHAMMSQKLAFRRWLSYKSFRRGRIRLMHHTSLLFRNKVSLITALTAMRDNFSLRKLFGQKLFRRSRLFNAMRNLSVSMFLWRRFVRNLTQSPDSYRKLKPFAIQQNDTWMYTIGLAALNEFRLKHSILHRKISSVYLVKQRSAFAAWREFLQGQKEEKQHLVDIDLERDEEQISNVFEVFARWIAFRKSDQLWNTKIEAWRLQRHFRSWKVAATVRIIRYFSASTPTRLSRESIAGTVITGGDSSSNRKRSNSVSSVTSTITMQSQGGESHGTRSHRVRLREARANRIVTFSEPVLIEKRNIRRREQKRDIIRGSRHYHRFKLLKVFRFIVQRYSVTAKIHKNRARHMEIGAMRKCLRMGRELLRSTIRRNIIGEQGWQILRLKKLRSAVKQLKQYKKLSQAFYTVRRRLVMRKRFNLWLLKYSNRIKLRNIIWRIMGDKVHVDMLVALREWRRIHYAEKDVDLLIQQKNRVKLEKSILQLMKFSRRTRIAKRDSREGLKSFNRALCQQFYSNLMNLLTVKYQAKDAKKAADRYYMDSIRKIVINNLHFNRQRRVAGDFYRRTAMKVVIGAMQRFRAAGKYDKALISRTVPMVMRIFLYRLVRINDHRLQCMKKMLRQKQNAATALSNSRLKKRGSQSPSPPSKRQVSIGSHISAIIDATTGLAGAGSASKSRRVEYFLSDTIDVSGDLQPYVKEYHWFSFNSLRKQKMNEMKKYRELSLQHSAFATFLHLISAKCLRFLDLYDSSARYHRKRLMTRALWKLMKLRRIRHRERRRLRELDEYLNCTDMKKSLRRLTVNVCIKWKDAHQLRIMDNHFDRNLLYKAVHAMEENILR